MVPFLSVLTALAVGVAIVGAQTGLMRLPQDDGNVCSTVMFECITTGRGTSEYGIPGTVNMITLRHSTFPDEESSNMESALGGDLVAKNYFEFNGTCNGSFCVAYRAKLIVRVTSTTQCKELTCNVELSGDTTPFGKELIQWQYPPPTDLSVVNRSAESVTVSWSSGAPDCSDITFEVTTNCGNCSQTFNTTNTKFTCLHLTAETECNVSVRSIQQCSGYSESRNVTVSRFIAPDSNSLAIPLGVGLGLGLPFLLSVIVAVAVIIIYCVCKKVFPRTSKTPPPCDAPTSDTTPLNELSISYGHDERDERSKEPPCDQTPHNTTGISYLSNDKIGETSFLKENIIHHSSPQKSEGSGNAQEGSSPKPGATGVSAADSSAPQLQERPQAKCTNEDDSKTHVATNTDVSGSPQSQPAEENPKKPEATGVGAADSNVPQPPEHAQESTDKVDSGSQAATNTDGSGPPQSQGGQKSLEDAQKRFPEQAQGVEAIDEQAMIALSGQPIVGQRIKSNGSCSVRKDSPPKARVSDSRGIPDYPGLGTQLHSFNDYTAALTEPKNLVEQSVSDIADRSNYGMDQDTPPEELGSSGGDIAQPAAQGHTGSTDEEELEPSSPISIPEFDDGAERSRFITVGIVPSSKGNKAALRSTLTLEQRVTATEKEIERLKGKDDSAEKERAKLREEIKILSGKLEMLQAQYDELAEKYETEKCSHAELKVRYASLEKKNKEECSQHSLERSRLIKENEDMRRKHEKEREKWKREKEALERIIKDTQDKLSDKQTRLKEIDGCTESASNSD